ncbi:MAG: 50S ribosomal protein L5 [alpha proteobacterium HIMB114]|nr:MAG: 50S ribosomal protein L5 [alpha proteobacterium HIMB114]|tara:strand:+ start:800 stop:1354 length:555 start_codon:yes stop_codon:yes gene_type:complete
MEPRLKSIYKSEILPQLKDSLGVKNVMQVPRLEKIVINMGLGLDANDNKVLKTIETDLANIAGQKPVVTKSKKAISNFKTRAKIPLGLKVTLRKNNMYFFLDRLINIALPRIKDFRGLNPKSFDDNANYSFGIKEHVIFPEVNFDKVDKVRGMDITVVTSTTDKNQAKALLDRFNFPFVKKGAN